MAEAKTVPTDASVEAFLATIPDEQKRRDSEAIARLMTEVTGEPPIMWGSAIVGFGTEHYVYASGRSGDWPPVAFSPRKANIAIYLRGGHEPHEEILARLGKYSTGKGCLYIKRLRDVDLAVFRELIEATVRNRARDA